MTSTLTSSTLLPVSLHILCPIHTALVTKPLRSTFSPSLHSLPPFCHFQAIKTLHPLPDHLLTNFRTTHQSVHLHPIHISYPLQHLFSVFHSTDFILDLCSHVAYSHAFPMSTTPYTFAACSQALLPTKLSPNNHIANYSLHIPAQITWHLLWILDPINN